MNPEKLKTFEELQDALAEILPERPSRRTINIWLELPTNPMPFVPKPGRGKGTGLRTHRWFRFSDVLAWLEDPVDFWARKKAS